MKTVLSFRSHLHLSQVPGLLLAFTVALAAIFTTGCGAGSHSPAPPVLSGNTSVVERR